MKDPEIVDFLKGFGYKKDVSNPKQQAEDWFKKAYPGIFPNWKKYKEHRYDDVEEK